MPSSMASNCARPVSGFPGDLALANCAICTRKGRFGRVQARLDVPDIETDLEPAACTGFACKTFASEVRGSASPVLSATKRWIACKRYGVGAERHDMAAQRSS